MRFAESFARKLLVEGNDDQHVIWALCNKFKIPQNFDVIDCEGIGNIFEQIPLRLKQSGVDVLGILIDADSDIRDRWQTLSGIFEKQGIAFPKVLPLEGLIMDAGASKIGVWVMPNNNLNGMLEDFISFLVPKENQLLPYADEALNQIEAKKLNEYTEAHRSKALIHTWLSWQSDPGSPLGLAITKKYVDSDKEISQKLVNWLTKTFE